MASDYQPTQYETETIGITGNTPNSPVLVAVFFKSGERTYKGRTDRQGSGSVNFSVGDAPVGRRVYWQVQVARVECAVLLGYFTPRAG